LSEIRKAIGETEECISALFILDTVYPVIIEQASLSTIWIVPQYFVAKTTWHASQNFSGISIVFVPASEGAGDWLAIRGIPSVTAAISQLSPSQIWQRFEKVRLRSPRSISLKYLLFKPHRSQKSFCFRPNSFREAFMRRPSLNSSTFVSVIFVSSFAKSPGFSEH
jgi:hypothetical protein